MSDSRKTLNTLVNRRSLAQETSVESLKHGGVLKCDCNNAIDLQAWIFVQPHWSVFVPAVTDERLTAMSAAAPVTACHGWRLTNKLANSRYDNGVVHQRRR